MKKNKRNAKTQRRKEGFFFTFFSFLTLSTCQDCFALQEAPWYGNVFEFNLLANYEYNFFKKVNHGTPQRRSVYNSNIFGAQIDLTAPIPGTGKSKSSLPAPAMFQQAIGALRFKRANSGSTMSLAILSAYQPAWSIAMHRPICAKH